ncbi:hypothetical protein BFP72_03200 [Reichenbachiella sp. 5M10]|uniref:hypothetical protein n=1 Tax=Reichenbachiella sp. 5M10 TaxID=1889772 RepID=UPI000C14DB12|nr:hypothetical protein [Reichenbachiella sp. 5M10]PIB34488.1 hypothetical protein BFP72_03200 [Reichenbachiella sp. 5M10]
MIQKLFNFFKRPLKSEPIEYFTFPTGKSRIIFPRNWKMYAHKKGESTFTFFNKELDGILYASELTNKNPEYQYTRNKSLEINSENSPKLVNISKHGAVVYCKSDESANVTYKHFEIGLNQTLLQFTWMTPYPNDEKLNKEIELILGSAEIG